MILFKVVQYYLGRLARCKPYAAEKHLSNLANWRRLRVSATGRLRKK